MQSSLRSNRKKIDLRVPTAWNQKKNRCDKLKKSNLMFNILNPAR